MAKQQAQGQAAAASTSESASVLDQLVTNTKQTERSRAEELIRTLVEEVNRGTVTVSKDVNRTIKSMMGAIDEVVSKQLAVIMHKPEFQKLEGTWRGLAHLVYNSETSTSLKIKGFNCSNKDL